MTSRAIALSTRSFVFTAIVVFSLFGFGCGGSSNSSTLSGNFVSSTTVPATRLVKLVPKTASGALMVVQAVIYGPDASLDMYTFAFDVKIGDTTVVQYVPSSAVAGNALVPLIGQSITTIAAPDAIDASHIVVGVGKLGGGVGNGVSGTSAVVVELTFQVLKPGVTTLAIAAAPAPGVLNQTGAPIPTITFDTAAATVTGLASGGGY